MRTSRLWAIFAFTLLLAAPASSFADQFSIFQLTTDNRTFLGLSSNGTAYFDYASTGLSYAYSNGVLTTTSSSTPTFTPDNGSPCAQPNSGRCNGGLDAYSAAFNGAPNAHLYWGTSAQDIWGTGVGPFTPVVSVSALNSIGDIVFDDQANDNWYEAVDLTYPYISSNVAELTLISNDAVAVPAPEPTTLILLSTGLLAPIVILRRRAAAATR